MLIQSQIDFSTNETVFTVPKKEIVLEVHTRENNIESEINLNENIEHFSDKCKKLLFRLLNGERLQFANEVKTIGDLHRRAKDLIDDNGIDVQRTFIKGSRIKEYWLKSEEIERCKIKYLIQ